jgi:hypothetical protein
MGGASAPPGSGLKEYDINIPYRIMKKANWRMKSFPDRGIQRD